MATPPTVVTSATGTSSGSTLNVVVPITVPPGLINPMLVVFANNPFGGQPASASWNGTPMSSVGLTSGYTWKQGFILTNPVAGSHNVQVNWGSFANTIAVTVVLLQDAGVLEQATSYPGFPFGSTGGQTITTTKADELLLGFFWNDAAATQSLPGSQTLISNLLLSSYRSVTFSKPAPVAGSNSTSVTFSGIVDWDAAIIAISPYVPSDGNFFLFF